ncbi:MAG: TlyA family RNA methyltransferase [Bacteroides sp.]|nr:TlyA family RNA methyltransferase [Eubacterium sp.]MCM1418943.1 TlyA family RNA methyltransferase [Roseburia sp.]MCM1462113.1 TlyA family RNA methyltransferase [Bacteroides sp.]
MRNRLDLTLTSLGLAKSRTAAQRLVASGCVLINGRTAEKPSETVDGETDRIEVKNAEAVLKYVGRGGFKLEHALKVFGLSAAGRVCLDVGASTGGFTDCMLKNGARRVYAVDVGHGQLAPALLADPRVVSLEGVDIRSADREIAERVGFIGIDVSFISLKLILPALFRYGEEGAEGVALIKPQFESGKGRVGKNGVIRDERAHQRIVDEIVSFAEALGFVVLGTTPSPILGGDGNREFLMAFRIG